MRKQANRGALLRYIGALLLFGSNGVVASRIALSSEQIVLLRTLIGTVALAGFFFLGRNKLRFFRYKGDFLFLMLSGLVMGIHWIFLYEAYRQVGVGVATLLCYCGPVIVMALSGLVFGERLTRWKLAGFAAVLLGVFLLNWEPPGQELNRFGIFCGVMSAVLYAGMIILNKKAARIQGVENSMLQLLFAFTAVAVVVVLRGELPRGISMASWPWILMLGLFNTGVGCWLYFSSIGKLPVQTVSVVGYLEPVSAVLFGTVFLRQVLDPAAWVGAALILGGAAFAELYRGKNKITKEALR